MMAGVCAAGLALAKEPWRDPGVWEINRLPARAVAVPCESAELALAIAKGERPRTDSAYLQSLNGTWDFQWKRAVDAPDWERRAQLAVPGCWQLQGDFDPPLYVNVTYPIAGFETGDPTVEPPASYTSHRYRTPVGLYSRTFTVPAAWKGRRVVVHFGGASSALYVRLNGREVGYSEDSRLPAEFDLTPFLKDGVNVIEAEVLKHSDGTYLEDQDMWRLSGLFRDVWLVAERPEAAKDLVVETTLTDDLKTGVLKVTDENGKTLLEKTYPDVRLWSCEYPNLYHEVVDVGGDFRAVQVGFRKIEIRDSVVLINGRRALFKGVDRHEMSPDRGYAVTVEDMKRDLEIFRDLNVNAVRTCHYPNDPTWYELCDRAGVYVVCEANIESHGAGYGEKTLAKNPLYHDVHVARGTNMVKTFRNHPSVIFWSLGNEAGDGPAFVDEYRAMKAIDATRPIQYERAENRDHTDVMCPMYASPKAVESYVKNNPKKPFILCEYTHAMGNSNGGIGEYWDLVAKYPSAQGGFIWDFADQAFWKKGAKGASLAYGGDYGDVPNDDNFNCNGIVAADRTYHPGAWEVKHAYRPVRVVDYDWECDEPRIVNDYAFVPMEELEMKKEVTDGGRTVTFRFFRDGRLVAWDQFRKPQKAASAPTGGTALAAHPFTLNFWRAPTDNDRGWKMPSVCEVWKTATETQTAPSGTVSKLDVKRLADGRLFVDGRLDVPEGLPPIPRVGLSFEIPKELTKATWNGLGPWENYSDRARGALFGTHTAEVTLARGLGTADGTSARPELTLNPDNYVEPGEQGHRGGCTACEFSGGGRTVRVTSVGAPFGINAWPYSQTALEAAKHQTDLAAGEAITVTVDAVQMGVGGDDSWGARPHAPFMPGKGGYRLAFVVEGL